MKLTDDRDMKDLGMKHNAIKGFFGEEGIESGIPWDELKAYDRSEADDAF